MRLGFSFAAAARAVEEQIYNNRPVQLSATWENEVIYPHYGGFSIANLSQSLLGLFGIPVEHPLHENVWDQVLDGQTVERVVLLLSDGLGYRLLQEMVAEDPVIYALVKRITAGNGPTPLTSTLPSTTAAALPTLWTGAFPGQHGMIGTVLYLRQLSTLINVLSYSPLMGSNPPGTLETWGRTARTFAPVPGFAERLHRVGVPTHLILAKELIGTGLSTILHRGVQHRYSTGGLADSWGRLRDVLHQTAGQRCFVTMYLSNVDALSHMYGQRSAHVKREIRRQLQALSELLEDRPARDGKTLVIMVADHGHIETRLAIDLDRDAAMQPLREALHITYAGDSSLSCLFIKADLRERVKTLLEERFSEHLTYADPAESITRGLFGPQADHPDLVSRLGDLLVISRSGVRLADQVRPLNAKSWHGGLSEWEMLVPVMWRRM